MTAVGFVLDADALRLYATGSERIGRYIADAADHDESVLITATSLADSFRTIDLGAFWYLEILAGMPHVVVAPLVPELSFFVGGWARKLGLELAHTAVEAASHPSAVFVTSRRELVTEHLPKEWPIIDL